MLTTCALASLFLYKAFAADVMVATFLAADSEVAGNVTVKDSAITVQLDLSQFVSGANVPSGCDTAQGFLYHVHTSWNNPANISYYGNHCNSTFVGGHYDPYAACGSKTGNTYCQVKGGCINTTYSCSGNYATNPYACEVGDWSGKYGTLSLTSDKLSASVSSFGDITGNQLVQKSVVFHCANNLKPAFCAPFLASTGTVGSITSRRQTSGFSLKADFSTAPGVNSKKSAYISFDFTGQVRYQFDTKSLQTTTPCTGKIVNVWIGDAWTDGTTNAQSTSCTSSLYGKFYDPTNQCYASTNGTDCIFCKKGKLCDNNGYSYSCDYANNPFTCSPMDFSGRYASLNLTRIDKKGFSYTSTDRYLADLTHLVHKSIVLVCADSKVPLYCAKIQNVGVGVAQATFSALNSGGEGRVTVRDGQVDVQIALDVAKSKYANGTVLPTTCFDSGVKVHIHEKWTYGDSTDRVGAAACGKTYTGGHWDPWAACSPTTGNSAVCKSPTPSPSPSKACVKVGGSVGNGTYVCDSTNYLTNPFACEVGDWSGKYGVYSVLGNSSQISRSDHSYMEVDATELVGKSVVFHCANDGTRALCAPFVLQNGATDGDDIPPTWSLHNQTDNLIYNASVNAAFGSIILRNTGHYYVNFNYSTSTCASGTTLGYGIFQDASCSKAYDPTVQCIPNSEYNKTLCLHQKTCNASSTYNCQFSTSPYSCSPSDLSGKYGVTDTKKTLLTSGWDDLMIPLNHLRTRYFGFYCTDTWITSGCTAWNVNVQVTKSPTTPPTKAPTLSPVTNPTQDPTQSPTPQPSPAPSEPTITPSLTPTFIPTAIPTAIPTPVPTVSPIPTFIPTAIPTALPTPIPTVSPTVSSTVSPTVSPTPSPIVSIQLANSVQTITAAICAWFALFALLWI